MIFKSDRALALRAGCAAAAMLMAGCVSVSNEPPEPSNPPRKEIFYAVTTSNQLIAFNAGQPQKILSKKPLTGLQSGEEILGVDYRVAKGVLFALGRTAGEGRLYTIDTSSGNRGSHSRCQQYRPEHAPASRHRRGGRFEPE
jgi:hypothetical protein